MANTTGLQIASSMTSCAVEAKGLNYTPPDSLAAMVSVLNIAVTKLMYLHRTLKEK